MTIGDPSNTITAPVSTADLPPRRGFGGLWERRVCLVPTWRGWLVLLVAGIALATVVGRNLYGFLALQDPVVGGVLVVEGWMPPYAVQEAAEEFRGHPYLALYVTGGPIEEDNPYFSYGTYAKLAAARLVDAGVPAANVHAVPAGFVVRDRTFNMAETLKQELERQGVSMAKINVMSIGPHARRSRLLYEMAFGRGTQVGVMAIVSREFDPAHWWRSSIGVRAVIDELVAYGYARVLFRV